MLSVPLSWIASVAQMAQVPPGFRRRRVKEPGAFGRWVRRREGAVRRWNAWGALTCGASQRRARCLRDAGAAGALHGGASTRSESPCGSWLKMNSCARSHLDLARFGPTERGISVVSPPSVGPEGFSPVPALGAHRWSSYRLMPLGASGSVIVGWCPRSSYGTPVPRADRADIGVTGSRVASFR